MVHEIHHGIRKIFNNKITIPDLLRPDLHKNNMDINPSDDFPKAEAEKVACPRFPGCTDNDFVRLQQGKDYRYGAIQTIAVLVPHPGKSIRQLLRLLSFADFLLPRANAHMFPEVVPRVSADEAM